MNDMEENASFVFSKLEQEFGVYTYLGAPSGFCQTSLGIEIEVPWSAYHPLLWEKYFDSGKRLFQELSNDEREELSRECKKEEDVLLQKFARAKRCMQTFQGIHYFEYCFPPTKNLSLPYRIAVILSEAGLCPFNGRHRMHVTIGGIKPSSYAYACLMYLELRYGTQERIRHGSKEKGGWAIKGQAGIYHKERRDLQFGYRDAIELRSLVLPVDLPRFAEFLSDIGYLSSLLFQAQDNGASEALRALQSKMKNLLIKHSLPYTLWPNPKEDERNWAIFTEVFSSLQKGIEPLTCKELS